MQSLENQTEDRAVHGLPQQATQTLHLDPLWWCKQEHTIVIGQTSLSGGRCFQKEMARDRCELVGANAFPSFVGYKGTDDWR